MSKKALLVTRVSGFVPQFEMNNVKILQEMGYEIHYAANFDVVVYGKDNSRLMGTGIHRHHIPFGRSPFSRDVRTCYLALKKLMFAASRYCYIRYKNANKRRHMAFRTNS